MYVNLSKNSIQYCKTVHRLVLTTFVENPNNFPHINHKDEDPTNNCLTNLEWCTEEYNHNYGTRNLRQSKALAKKVNVYDLDHNFICQYNSIKEASEKLHIDASKISKICKNKWKFYTPYLFEYENQIS